MAAEHSIARRALETARETFIDNVASVTLQEALDAAGGMRSVLGLMKHTAAWADVYRSYAFDQEPRGWTAIDWPNGLRGRIEPSQAYLDEVRAWFERASAAWLEDVQRPDADLDDLRRVHWGDSWPLGDIVAWVASHWSYHAGEINALLAIVRGEAWEYGEHVEENHIVTIGHSVRRPWITDDDVRRYEDDMRRAAATRESDARG